MVVHLVMNHSSRWSLREAGIYFATMEPTSPITRAHDFNAINALGNNTYNLPACARDDKAANCHRLLLSGSVFEGGEGAGSQGLPNFSPYGLSKALTFQVFRYYCTVLTSASASSSSPIHLAPTKNRDLPVISSRTG